VRDERWLANHRVTLSDKSTSGYRNGDLLRTGSHSTLTTFGNSQFELRLGPFEFDFVLFAGIGLIVLSWWTRLATLENIWHVDRHTQFDVAAGGGGAGLGLWPNELRSLLVAIP
jgi:hypothetical protein